MKILALDIASCTGVCVGGRGIAPALSHLTIGKKSNGLGHFLADAQAQFRNLVRTERPDVIVFEAPILRAITTIDTTRKLQGLAGLIELEAYINGIDIYEVTTGEIKVALSGTAHADKPFQIRAAEIMGLLPRTADEADAFGVWLCAIEKLAPDLLPFWKARQQVPEWSENLADAKSALAAKRAKKKAAVKPGAPDLFTPKPKAKPKGVGRGKAKAA